MKLTLLLIPLLFLSSCTIDWSDEKGKKVTALEKQIEETNKKIEENTNKTDLWEKKSNFEYDIKCQDRAIELKKTANNIVSGYYSADENKCYLKVFNKNTNSLEEWPIDTFGPTNLMPKNINHEIINSTPTAILQQDVNLRELASIEWTIIQTLIKWEKVTVIKDITIWGQVWYNVTSETWNIWWISALWFQENYNAQSLADDRKIFWYWFTPHSASINITFSEDHRFIFNDYNTTLKMDEILKGKFRLLGENLTLEYDDRKSQIFRFYKWVNTDTNYYISNISWYYFVKQ